MKHSYLEDVVSRNLRSINIYLEGRVDSSREVERHTRLFFSALFIFENISESILTETICYSWNRFEVIVDGKTSVPDKSTYDGWV